MKFAIECWLWFLIISLDFRIVESRIIIKKSQSFIGTSKRTINTFHIPRNNLNILRKGITSNSNLKKINLKLSEDSKNYFSDLFSDKESKYAEGENTHNHLNNKLVQNSGFGNLIISNSGILILVLLYLIRIFKTLVYARSFLESLIHINPYLPPFNIVYETTNFYMKFCDIFPDVMGIKVLSEIPWFIINNIERYLQGLIQDNS